MYPMVQNAKVILQVTCKNIVCTCVCVCMCVCDNQVKTFSTEMAAASCVCMDGNIPETTMRFILEHCRDNHTPGECKGWVCRKHP